MNQNNLKSTHLILSSLFALMLSGCGGGGSSTPETSSPDDNNNTPSSNTAPSIMGSPLNTIAENSQYTFLPTATDANNDVLMFTIQNKPIWAQFSQTSGLLTGTPNFEQAGTYSNIIISVSDQQTSTSLPPFSIEVSNTNRQPVLQNELTAKIPESLTRHITITATDPDQDNILINVEGLPSWANFDANTAQIIASPTSKDSGVYNQIKITLNDGSNNLVRHDFTLTVTDSVTVKGKVIDGYISGAIVYLDLNLNGEFDEDEPNTTTDANGNYELLLTDDEVTAATTAPIRSYIGEGATDSDRPDKNFANDPVTISTAPLVDLTHDDETIEDVSVTPYTNQVVTKISGSLTSGVSSTELSALITTAEDEVVEDVINDLNLLDNLTLSAEKLSSLKSNLKESVILGDFIAFDKTSLPSDISNELDDIDNFVDELQTKVKKDAQDEIDAIGEINIAPKAKAGPDQNVEVNSTVVLDGRNSRDQNNDALTYSWSLSAPANSTSFLIDSTIAQASFTPDIAGSYIASLIVNDGQLDSSADTVIIVVTDNNAAPVANAGLDQSVLLNSTVTLDASGSTDANMDSLTYAWTLSSPTNTTVTLMSANSVSPTFIADSIGTYNASLVVSDGKLQSATDSVAIVVNQLNTAPIASVGITNDGGYTVGDVVTVYGGNSVDAENAALSYQWTLTAPNSSTAQLTSSSSDMPSFTADIAGVYTLTLIVNDGELNSEPANLSITVSALNTAPIASAGITSDGGYTVGDVVQVTAANSQDAEGDSLTYLWTLEPPSSAANNSTATLSNNTDISPNFTADIAGTYGLTLIVSDGKLQSQATQLSIIVAAINTAPNAVASVLSDSGYRINDTVNVTGITSHDSENDTLTYLWNLTTIPDNSQASLTNTTSVSPSFVADVEGNYILSLIVNDGALDSSAAVLNITVTDNNSMPVANAGSDTSITTGETLTLDGSASSDANSDQLTYNWVITQQPTYSVVNIVDQTSVSPQLTPDMPGDYTLSLIVNDGSINSDEDTITITAVNSQVDIKDDEFINRNDSCDNYAGTYFANVSDIKNATNFTSQVEITVNGDSCTIVSNSIPNHDFNDDTASFAHNTAEISLTYSVPITPTVARRVKQISLGTTNAILLNGVEVDILPAACYNEGDEALGTEKKGCSDMGHPWRYDPMFAANKFGTDAHNAHTQSTGLYHYHGNPLAMFDQDCDVNGVASPVIGFAADGYPVYGMCFTDAATGNVKKATSSYALKNAGGLRSDEDGYLTPTAGNGSIQSDNYDGQFRNDYEYVENSGDLDECNGMEVNGQYGYYITDAFPWVLNCYKGDIDASFSFSSSSSVYSQKLHAH